MEQPPTPQPAAAPVTPAKKGLPALAWVGIGCGGLVVIAIIVMIIGGVWFTKKAKELGVDFQKNPERAAAELVVNLSPDLEKVSTDEEAGTMTIRKQDGTEMTLTYQDISEGKFIEAPAADPAVEIPAEE